ncbi:MAG TPA: ABC transporter permease subunit [Actinomycetota bacterium]|nr:ABC transporter permease subunit [Actinomycetota bacterium]
MGLLADAFRWLTDPAHYGGPNGIPTRVLEHVQISFQAVAVAAIVAVPVGLFIGHRRRFESVATTIGGLGRALPSFGVLGILFGPTLAWPGKIGYWATFIALILLSIPPLLISTYVSIKGVDDDLVEAARGMGMSGTEILRRVKIPLGMPLIVSGFRIASVQSIATATLWGVAGGGAIGRYIVDGFASQNRVLLLAGAILVALVAIATEFAFGVAARLLSPKTTSHRNMPGAPPASAPTPV